MAELLEREGICCLSTKALVSTPAGGPQMSVSAQGLHAWSS